jgi:hypothetical protein
MSFNSDGLQPKLLRVPLQSLDEMITVTVVDSRGMVVPAAEIQATRHPTSGQTRLTIKLAPEASVQPSEPQAQGPVTLPEPPPPVTQQDTLVEVLTGMARSLESIDKNLDLATDPLSGRIRIWSRES